MAASLARPGASAAMKAPLPGSPLSPELIRHAALGEDRTNCSEAVAPESETPFLNPITPKHSGGGAARLLHSETDGSRRRKGPDDLNVDGQNQVHHGYRDTRRGSDDDDDQLDGKCRLLLTSCFLSRQLSTGS